MATKKYVCTLHSPSMGIFVAGGGGGAKKNKKYTFYFIEFYEFYEKKIRMVNVAILWLTIVQSS